MEKMKKLARCIDAITLIFMILMLFAGIALTVILVSDSFGFREDILNYVSGITINDIMIKLDVSTLPAWYWGVTASIMLLIILFLEFCIFMVRKILKPMKEGNPFDGTTSKNTFILGRCVSGGYIAAFAISKLMFFLTASVLPEYLQPNMVQNIDLTGLIPILLIFLIGYIFKYGEELQMQVDETL